MSRYKAVILAIKININIINNINNKDTYIHTSMYNSSIENNQHAKYLPFIFVYYIGFYRPQQTTDI